MAGRYLYLVEAGAGFVAAVREAATLAFSEHTNLKTEAHGGLVSREDGRLTDARPPTAHKASHASGADDALAPGDIGAAPSTRAVNTSAPLTGGGDLSANRTLGLEDVTGLSPGTYERATVTVDAKGRVTAVAVGAAGAIADASPTQKGAVLLTAAMPQGEGGNPKAVSYNDPRMQKVDGISSGATQFSHTRASSYAVHNANLSPGTSTTTADLRGANGVPADAKGVRLQVLGVTSAGRGVLAVEAAGVTPSGFSPRLECSPAMSGTELTVPLGAGDVGTANGGKVAVRAETGLAAVSSIFVYVVGWWR